MNKRQMRDRIAYHEAGHAAMLWLTGFRFEHVRIEDFDSATEIKGGVSVRSNALDPAYRVRPFLDRSPAIARAGSNLICIFSLAGSVAQYAKTDELDEWWETEAIDLAPEWEGNPNHDLSKALAATLALGLTERQAWHRMNLCRRWTETLVSDSRLWPAIDALAKQLRTRDMIDGDEAAAIMDAATSIGQLPILSFERSWQRRLFGPTIGT